MWRTRKKMCMYILSLGIWYNLEFQFGGNWMQIFSVSKQTLRMGPISCVSKENQTE